MKITSSDLLNFLLILHTISSNRFKDVDGMDDGVQASRRVSMKVICYLATVIQISQAKQHACCGQFIEHVKKFIADDEYIEHLMAYFHSITSTDDLDAEIEKGQLLFEISGESSQNHLTGPNTLSKSSTLGIFVRRVLAGWQCMLFDEVCDVFDTLQAFLASTDPLHSTGSTHNLLEHAEQMLQSRNISDAEELIHSYYDGITDPSNALRFPGRDNHHLVTNSDKLYAVKNQYAMMSLAVMHMHAGNWSQTAIAIEEALKTAHQRGDHASVAKCLMFLHQLSLHGDHQESEDMIRRSMQRAATYSLDDLVANAALLLAAFKSRPSDWTAMEVWELFNYALHGETALTMQYANNKQIVTNLDESLATGTSNPLMLRQQQMQQTQSTAEHPSILDADYVQRHMFASVLVAEHWLRQGQTHFAALAVMRSLKLYGACCRPLDMLTVSTKLLDIKLNLIARSNLEAVDAIIQQIRALRCELTSRLPEETLEMLDCVMLKALIMKAVLNNQLDRACKYAEQILSLSQTAFAGAQTSVSSLSMPGVAVDSLRCRLLCVAVAGLLQSAVGDTGSASRQELEKECEQTHCEYILQEELLVMVQDHIVS